MLPLKIDKYIWYFFLSHQSATTIADDSPGDNILWENGDRMLWEDGSFIVWE